MSRPGDIVEVDHYTAPTGGDYTIEVYSKRSGGYAVLVNAMSGGKGMWLRTDVGKGYKTIRGAIRGGHKAARDLEDITYRAQFDDVSRC